MGNRAARYKKQEVVTSLRGKVPVNSPGCKLAISEAAPVRKNTSSLFKHHCKTLKSTASHQIKNSLLALIRLLTKRAMYCTENMEHFL